MRRLPRGRHISVAAVALVACFAVIAAFFFRADHLFRSEGGEKAAVDETLAESRRLLAAGETRAGRAGLRERLEHHPTDAVARLLLAASYLSERPAEVRLTALEMLSEGGANADALDMLSLAYERVRARGFTRKKEVESRSAEIMDYQQVLEANPDWPAALYRSAAHRIALQRLEPSRTHELTLSIQELGRVIALLDESADPVRSASANHQLGRAYKHRGDAARSNNKGLAQARPDYDIALMRFSRVLDLDPKRIDALGEIILIYQAIGQPEKAIEETLRRASSFARKPSQSKLQEMLGALYVATGQIVRARQSFERAIALNQYAFGSYLYLSQIAAEGGSCKESTEVLHRVINIEPDFIEGYQHLAMAETRCGDMAAAITTYRKLLDVDPGQAVFIGMVPSQNLYRNNIYYSAAATLADIYWAKGNSRDTLAAIAVAKNFAEPNSEQFQTILGYEREIRSVAKSGDRNGQP